MQAARYHPDLKAFSLEKLEEKLKNGRLLPSQKILGEQVDEHMACLRRHGIENLQQLQEALKSKPDIQSFSNATGLPVVYLTILRREVNSYQPKPIALKDFPDVDLSIVQKLASLGIRNTAQLFSQVLNPDDRLAFSKQHQVDHQVLMELTHLTDLARLKWVGPKFARLLIESGFDTVEKVATSDARELYATVMRVKDEKEIYAGSLSLEDIQEWIKFAIQDVPWVIRY